MTFVSQIDDIIQNKSARMRRDTSRMHRDT